MDGYIAELHELIREIPVDHKMRPVFDSWVLITTNLVRLYTNHNEHRHHVPIQELQASIMTLNAWVEQIGADTNPAATSIMSRIFNRMIDTSSVACAHSGFVTLVAMKSKEPLEMFELERLVGLRDLFNAALQENKTWSGCQENNHPENLCIVTKCFVGANCDRLLGQFLLPNSKLRLAGEALRILYKLPELEHVAEHCHGRIDSIMTFHSFELNFFDKLLKIAASSNLLGTYIIQVLFQILVDEVPSFKTLAEMKEPHMDSNNYENITISTTVSSTRHDRMTLPRRGSLPLSLHKKQGGSPSLSGTVMGRGIVNAGVVGSIVHAIGLTSSDAAQMEGLKSLVLLFRSKTNVESILTTHVNWRDIFLPLLLQLCRSTTSTTQFIVTSPAQWKDHIKATDVRFKYLVSIITSLHFHALMAMHDNEDQAQICPLDATLSWLQSQDSGWTTSVIDAMRFLLMALVSMLETHLVTTLEHVDAVFGLLNTCRKFIFFAPEDPYVRRRRTASIITLDKNTVQMMSDSKDDTLRFGLHFGLDSQSSTDKKKEEEEEGEKIRYYALSDTVLLHKIALYLHGVERRLHDSTIHDKMSLEIPFWKRLASLADQLNQERNMIHMELFWNEVLTVLMARYKNKHDYHFWLPVRFRRVKYSKAKPAPVPVYLRSNCRKRKSFDDSELKLSRATSPVLSSSTLRAPMLSASVLTPRRSNCLLKLTECKTSNLQHHASLDHALTCRFPCACLVQDPLQACSARACFPATKITPQNVTCVIATHAFVLHTSHMDSNSSLIPQLLTVIQPLLPSTSTLPPFGDSHGLLLSHSLCHYIQHETKANDESDRSSENEISTTTTISTKTSCAICDDVFRDPAHAVSYARLSLCTAHATLLQQCFVCKKQGDEHSLCLVSLACDYVISVHSVCFRCTACSELALAMTLHTGGNTCSLFCNSCHQQLLSQEDQDEQEEDDDTVMPLNSLHIKTNTCSRFKVPRRHSAPPLREHTRTKTLAELLEIARTAANV